MYKTIFYLQDLSTNLSARNKKKIHRPLNIDTLKIENHKYQKLENNCKFY